MSEWFRRYEVLRCGRGRGPAPPDEPVSVHRTGRERTRDEPKTNPRESCPRPVRHPPVGAGVATLFDPVFVSPSGVGFCSLFSPVLTGRESRVGDLRLDPYPPILVILGILADFRPRISLKTNHLKNRFATDVGRFSNRCGQVSGHFSPSDLSERCGQVRPDIITL